MFKGIAGLGSLIKHAQEMGGRLQAIKEDMRTRRVSGSAGGGMVTVEANGLNEVLTCRIDQQLFDQGDRELIEDMVASAVNQALGKAKELHTEAMKSITGGMPIPGLDSFVDKLMSDEEE